MNSMYRNCKYIYISLTLQTDDKSDIDTIARIFTKSDYK